MAADRIQIGSRYLVRFADDPAVLHERRVLAVEGLASGDGIILTPDYDVYHMTLRAPPLAEIHAVEGSSGGVKLPRGVRRRDVYLFEDARGEPSTYRLRKYTTEAVGIAEQWAEDNRPTLPTSAAPARRVTGKSPGEPVEATATLPPSTSAGSDGNVWVVAEYGRATPLGTIMIPGSTVVTIAGRAVDPHSGLFIENIRAGLVDAYPTEWFKRTGLVDPRATPRSALNLTIEKDDAQDEAANQVDGLDLLRADLLGDKGASTAGIAAGADPSADARVLPVLRDARGRRYRGFREGVEALSESDWADWPVVGPRTVLWCLQFIMQHFTHPDQRHSRWMSDCKLSYNDMGATEHQSIMRLVSFALTYDQLDMPQLASMELLLRRAQMIELKYKDKVVPRAQDAQDPFQDVHLYMGLSQTRGMLMVCPALEKYIGEELHKEAFAAKERRKAAEERAAAGKK